MIEPTIPIPLLFRKNLPLPEEIIYLIFDFAADDIYATLLLSHVSHTWRKITYSHTPPWGRLHTSSLRKLRGSRSIHFLKACFNRAQNVDLRIDLQMRAHIGKLKEGPSTY